MKKTTELKVIWIVGFDEAWRNTGRSHPDYSQEKHYTAAYRNGYKEGATARKAAFKAARKSADTWVGNLFPAKKSVKTTDSYGDTVWRNKDGQLHRDPKEGPARIWANGTQEYYFNGQLHRDPKEGPAYIDADGRQQYWFNGQLHRDPKEGPARIWADDGTQEYWFEGQLHRDPKEGPAYIGADGGQEYWFNGLRVYP